MTAEMLGQILEALLGSQGGLYVGAAMALGVIELYRSVRDTLSGDTPDALTDAQLAELLSSRGAALQLSNDHWLVEHGFTPSTAPGDASGS